MTTAPTEAEWLHRFQSQIRPRLLKALVRLEEDVSRKGDYCTSIVDERAGTREVAFRVGLRLPARSRGTTLTLCTCCRLSAVAIFIAGCAPTSSPQPTEPTAGKSDCRVGGDARGIAAGFFALTEDRPECF